MPTFEMTIEMPNGDWPYRRIDALNYHIAANEGLKWANIQGGNLIRVERMPPTVVADKATYTVEGQVFLADGFYYDDILAGSEAEARNIARERALKTTWDRAEIQEITFNNVSATTPATAPALTSTPGEPTE